MKRICFITLLVITLTPVAAIGNSSVFLNAFGETATAYINDAILLLGTVADSYTANTYQPDKAGRIVSNVQKRVRIVRAKLQAVGTCDITEADRKLVRLLDKAYACADHEAWALLEYVKKKDPELAKRFEEQRQDCIRCMEQIVAFYEALPPSSEKPEPLSTR